MPDGTKRWRTVEVDEDAVAALAQALDLPPAAAKLLALRGFTEPAAASVFLDPRLSNLSDPFALPDVEAAAERIWAAIDKSRTIVVFGDYDADGVTSTALLVRVLRALGACVEPFLPSRFKDGYGLTIPALERCLETLSPELLVTVDCGTMSVDAVRVAGEHGVDVIVTDHHEISGPVAEACAVVNPKRSDNESTRMLAGVGVAFKLCHGIVKKGIADARDVVKTVDLREWLDIVALGTVADMVPLLEENRILVRHGVGRINRSPCLGLEELIRDAAINVDVNCYHLGFLLGPRLNAAGRLGSAETGLELLLTEDREVACRIARELGEANRERRRIEEGMREEAFLEIDGYFAPDEHFGLVVAQPGWHEGTIGLVASRVSARYYRPSVMIAVDEEGKGKGSCRSIEELDLIGVLHECDDLLDRYGGHQMAAGLSISCGNIEAFRERFNYVCAEKLKGQDLRQCVDVAAWIGLGEADDALFNALSRLRPLGQGNPEPVWGVRGVQMVGQPRIVGDKHLKFLVASGGTQMDAIAFGMADHEIPEGDLDVIFNLRDNTYMGRRSLQLNVRDFRSHGTADG